MSGLGVVHVVDSLASASGGTARCVADLVEALALAGARPAIVSRVGPRPPALPAAIPVDIVGRAGLFGNHVRAAVRARARALEAQLVHVHGIWRASNHGAMQAARDLNLPCVATPHGMLEPWALARHGLRKRVALALWQRRDLAGARFLHCTAPAEAQHVAALSLGVPTVVIPNGVFWAADDASFSTDARPLVDGRRTAVFLSRLHPKKGLPLWVEAWRRVVPTGWRMEVHGPDEGGHRRVVEKLVEKADLAATWSFFGEADDRMRAEVLARAHLFVLPSHSENFGLVVGEALAAGVPVLTTTATPWTDLGERGMGWAVSPQVGALADALADAAARPSEELAAMGARGAAWVREHFAWEAIGQEMLAAYSAGG